MGGIDAAFKCRVLRSLTTIDPRFPALVRVVKAWAAARNLNDASKCTLNTYAIVLLVRNAQAPSLAYKSEIGVKVRYEARLRRPETMATG